MNKLGDEKGFLGGYSADDLMTLATAKELPKIEEKYRAKEAEIADMQQVLEAYDGPDTREIAELQMKWRAARVTLARMKQNLDHALACARYVKEVMGKEPY